MDAPGLAEGVCVGLVLLIRRELQGLLVEAERGEVPERNQLHEIAEDQREGTDAHTEEVLLEA